MEFNLLEITLWLWKAFALAYLTTAVAVSTVLGLSVAKTNKVKEAIIKSIAFMTLVTACYFFFF